MRSPAALFAACLAFSACAPATYVRDWKSDPRPVAVRPLPGGRWTFESKLAIDTDGTGPAWKTDPAGQAETSLRYPGGASLDPSEIPYFVLPLGFERTEPKMRLGDLAAVTYQGKTAFALYGDEGPRGQIGEGSIALARALGIDADPVTGGVEEGVVFVLFPGSGDGAPLDSAEIARRGARLLSATARTP